MKFFNIDLHISVIADVKNIFNNLGHQVDNWSLSEHSWVFGESQKNIEIINQSNWINLNQEMCDIFYETYKDQLSEYDAFITSYVPGFSTLYEKFDKPIIFICPIRYEHPFTDNPEKWKWLNNHIEKGVKRGKIIPVANNKFDLEYFKSWVNCNIEHIPSLCEYTNSHHNPKHDFWICKSVLNIDLTGTNIHHQVDILPNGYSWESLYSFYGIVHFPYQISTMSIFEQYSAGVPMLFPTKRFSKELYKESFDHGDSAYLNQLSFNRLKNLGTRSLLDPQYSDLDLNNYSSDDVIDVALNLADFYDEELMPAINYFDSFDELDKMTENIGQFKPDNRQHRKELIYSKWENIIEKIS